MYMLYIQYPILLIHICVYVDGELYIGRGVENFNKVSGKYILSYNVLMPVYTLYFYMYCDSLIYRYLTIIYCICYICRSLTTPNHITFLLSYIYSLIYIHIHNNTVYIHIRTCILYMYMPYIYIYVYATCIGLVRTNIPDEAKWAEIKYMIFDAPDVKGIIY